MRKPAAAIQDERREKEERDHRALGVIVAVFWFVLPVTFGCIAAAHGLPLWLGFLLGALANGVLRFLWRPLLGGMTKTLSEHQ
ncbi:MAG: hypothetical protein IJQ73_05775 [Kiritimatiellae bacterium]|nr:hypothetical protein [Kiritimatiellia bacterium]